TYNLTSFDPVTGSGSITVTFLDGPNTATVSVQVEDSDGAAGADSLSVVVANVAPTVTLSGPATADEGDTLTYTFTTSDPGVDTFNLLGITVGPDATYNLTSFDPVTGSGSFTVTFLDGPNTATVSVQVEDSDGAAGADSLSVVVANVAPTVTLSGPATADEGDTLTYTFTTSDPGVDTFNLLGITVGPDATYNLTSFDPVTGSGSITVTFLDGPN